MSTTRRIHVNKHMSKYYVHIEEFQELFLIYTLYEPLIWITQRMNMKPEHSKAKPLRTSLLQVVGLAKCARLKIQEDSIMAT